MNPDLGRALEVAVAAARAAGGILLRDFHRVGGARGHGDKAEADVEAEREIRARLLQAFPAWGYLGEETGRGPQPPAGAPTWLVDPNDGTRDYLEGRRGSAVSIGLVSGGLPVLGVVFAFAYPDDDGDLFAWAEGQGPLLRNGQPAPRVAARPLAASDVVLVSSTADRDPKGNLDCVAPARFRAVPSIAHRLALVAAGEAVATSALFAPREWDYGGGHALLRAAGGALVDETRVPVRYADDGSSSTRWTLGGSPRVVDVLAQRPWASLRGGAWGADRPVRLVRGEAVADPGLLSRAQGCLLGLIAGGSFGATRLEDGGREGPLAGQPTPACESALALARSIVSLGSYSDEVARGASGAPGDEPPGAALARAAVLGVFGAGLTSDDAGDLAAADYGLMDPADAVGRSCSGAMVAAMAHAVRNGGPGPSVHAAAMAWARRAGGVDVTEALQSAEHAPPAAGERGPLAVLHRAFFVLLQEPLVETAMARAVGAGDAALDAAVAGALLGAVHGRSAIPMRWRSLVLSCRPHPARTSRPRPRAYWPIDTLELAERLLLAGGRAGRGR